MLGTPDDPMLPRRTFDRIFLVHMYHEVTSPYAFLWHMREGLKPGGIIAVVEADRSVRRHGMPPEQLKCEFAALNLAPVKFSMLTGGETYYMAFRVAGPRPAPEAIKPCKGKKG
jgi:SAM-dependent methyltransferase